MTYTLLELQQTFTVHLAKLIVYASAHGYQLTFGEAWRPPETAELYAKQGKGIKGSLHTSRLAVDFNLFAHGEWKKLTEDFKPLGEYWESLSTPGVDCSWGGRFKDACHFSIAYDGKR